MRPLYLPPAPEQKTTTSSAYRYLYKSVVLAVIWNGGNIAVGLPFISHTHASNSIVAIPFDWDHSLGTCSAWPPYSPEMRSKHGVSECVSMWVRLSMFIFVQQNGSKQHQWRLPKRHSNRCFHSITLCTAAALRVYFVIFSFSSSSSTLSHLVAHSNATTKIYKMQAHGSQTHKPNRKTHKYICITDVRSNTSKFYYTVSGEHIYWMYSIIDRTYVRSIHNNETIFRQYQ